EDNDAEQDCRQTLQSKEPLPSRQSQASGKEAQDVAGDWTADDSRDRAAGQQERHHARAAVRRKPVCEIQNHAGEESGFRDTQKKTGCIELRRSTHDRSAGRDNAPCYQHTADPDACAYPVQNEIAWDLEDEVTQEEDARAETIHAFTELEIAQHL